MSSTATASARVGQEFLSMQTKSPEVSLRGIGPYEDLEKIAEGGTATVYKGRHHITGEVVAVKVLRSDLAGEPVVVSRFEQEYRVASSLDHPNIVRGLDYGRDGAVPYLAMELVEGRSLGQRIEDEGRLPEDEAVRIISQVAHALDLAHQLQIIHRDVKPDNILLTPDGQAKLTDLGLVKDEETCLGLTRPGGGLGTPNFMAPEQFGDAKHADARCDLYSLAATLYMAVTGKLPFQARGFSSILKKKLQNDITPPIELVRTLRPETDLAIRRALRADPGQRHASCLEFLAALAGKTPPPAEMETAAPPANMALRAGLARHAKDERRAALRYPTGLATSCCPMARFKELEWSARVQDISCAGVRITLGRRFEPGTLLFLVLQGERPGITPTLVVRVLRANKASSKVWELGGVFLRKLSEIELEALL
jgi:serine/threonine protein kinase